MRCHLSMPDDLRRAYLDAGIEETAAGAPTIVATGPVGDEWATTLDQLTDVYRAARSAAIEGSPVVFVVSAEGLLGRLGATEAMAATGIVSGARTLALETKKAGVPVNCIATGPETPVATVVDWATRLLGGGPDGPSGEVIQLGGIQVGKALS